MLDQAYKLREYYNSPKAGEQTAQEIISVTSGKGGTGKSVTAFYLAQMLANKGYKTLLVEFDFNLGSLEYHLNISPRATIYDLFSGTALFEEALTEISPNFHVIFGDNGKLNFPENRISHIQNFFVALKNKATDYDFVIIDNGAGISNEIFETIKNSTLNLIVTLQDPVAVMDAYVLIKLMAKNSIKCKKGIIINKCSSATEGEVAFQNLHKATKHFFKEEIHLIGLIPENDFCKSINMLDEHLISRSKTHPVITEITSAALKISTIAQLANNHQ